MSLSPSYVELDTTEEEFINELGWLTTLAVAIAAIAVFAMSHSY